MTQVQLASEAGEHLVPELRFAAISVAASQTDSVLVTGVSGNKVRVLSYMFVASAGTTALFESGTTTALSGTVSLAANGVASFGGAAHAPAFETVSGENLVVTTGGGAIEGHLCYVLIPPL